MSAPRATRAMLAMLALTVAAASGAYGQTVHGDGSVPRRSPAPCSAPPPRKGEVFSGPVLEVLDGRTLCVAQGPTSDRWIQVQLPASAGRGDRGGLMAAAFAKRVTCVARRVLDQGVAADCAIEGVALTDRMRDETLLADGKDRR
jgi:hypothetical protein